MIAKYCKQRLTSLGMVWIDYRKAYDTVPHSWILKSMEMLGVSENVSGLISKSMNNRNTELTEGCQSLRNVKIRWGIFQGDGLPPLFVLAMISLTLLLGKTKMSYQLKKGDRINHLLFMDDLKLFLKTQDQLERLINTERIFSYEIKMEFGLSNCAVLIMKRGKILRTEIIIMPNGNTMKNLEESTSQLSRNFGRR